MGKKIIHIFSWKDQIELLLRIVKQSERKRLLNYDVQRILHNNFTTITDIVTKQAITTAVKHVYLTTSREVESPHFANRLSLFWQ